MSDFVNSGWSVFIAVATIISLLACLRLLYFASRRRPMASDNSTGHVFDEDLVEMNNPLSRWWAILFVITVVFAFGYVYAFPALGSRPGKLAWSSQGEHDADRAQADATVAKVYAPFAQIPADTLSRDRQAMAIGQRLFLNNYAACHGPDARGSKGFPNPADHGAGGKGNQAIDAPNLSDQTWLHGYGEDAIVAMVDNGKTNIMPAQGGRLTKEQIHVVVAAYVWSLSHSPPVLVAR